MRKSIVALLLCLLVSGLSAQKAADLFVDMPNDLIPQLEKEWRMDLIDLYQGDKEARLKNIMESYSKLTNLTDDYLRVESTERTVVEMKVLPLVNNTAIICLVTTVDGPIADSRVAFYTTEWELLNPEDLYEPVTLEWFMKVPEDPLATDYLMALSRLDMDLVECKLSPDNQTLTAVYNTPLYLSGTDRELVRPFLKDTPRVYTWQRGHFK